MIGKQEHDARTYQNRKNRNSAEAPTREDGDEHHNTGNGASLESGSSATHYGEADTREGSDCTTHGDTAALTDSATFSNTSTARTNKRKQGESNTGSTVPAVRPESVKVYDQETSPTISTNDARQSLPAGELLERVENGQSDSHCGDNSPAGPAGLFPEESVKKPYGTCKHVMLTDAEGHHLREVYGTDLALAIEILDAYLENNPKALKKYKNHAAVLRKGNWVWKEVQENKINATRLENAINRQAPKDFRSMREDEQKRRAFNTLFETEVPNVCAG